jgi:electron transfer flavoprotein beta subunit
VNIAVCIKRIPLSPGKWTLTADETAIDTSGSAMGWTLSPHEECAVEAAVQLAEGDGTVTAFSLGTPESSEQIREVMAVGVDRGVLLETDGADWDGQATAAALAAAITADETDFDAVILGTESADASGYQVGVRIAHALGWPIVTNVKGLSVEGGVARCERVVGSEREVYEVTLPAVIAVKDGVNIPRYPSVPGRIKARKKPLDTVTPESRPARMEKVKLALPPQETSTATVLGSGADAAPKVVEVLKEIGVLT